MFRLLAACAAIVIISSAAFAGPVINAGNHNLLPDQANQKILIYISGGDLVQNVNLNAQIGDGGPEVNGTIVGPSFTNLDILTETIFAGNNTGRASGTSNGLLVPQVAYEGTTTANGFVTASGLLATLTVNTTGFQSGTFSLMLAGTLNGDTTFANSTGTGILNAAITNGTITIVPEPAAMSFMLLGLAAVLRKRRQ